MRRLLVTISVLIVLVFLVPEAMAEDGKRGKLIEMGDGLYRYEGEDCVYRHCPPCKECPPAIVSCPPTCPEIPDCNPPDCICPPLECPDCICNPAEKEPVPKATRILQPVHIGITTPKWSGHWFIPISVMYLGGSTTKISWVMNIDPSIKVDTGSNWGIAAGAGYSWVRWSTSVQLLYMPPEDQSVEWLIKPPAWAPVRNLEISQDPSARWGAILTVQRVIGKKK